MINNLLIGSEEDFETIDLTPLGELDSLEGGSKIKVEGVVGITSSVEAGAISNAHVGFRLSNYITCVYAMIGGLNYALDLKLRLRESEEKLVVVGGMFFYNPKHIQVQYLEIIS